MDRPPIVIVGSANVDHVFQTPRLPKPGETILGRTFKICPGGKGANQAVAAGRLGGSVCFIGCVGDDSDGQLLLTSLGEAGVDLKFLRTEAVATGAAGIFVDDEGANVIVVAPGANDLVSQAQVMSALKAAGPEFVLCQLEVPLEAVSAAASAAKFILNPAPACELPPEILVGCFAITPNETELEFLTGIAPVDEASCLRAARKLLDKGISHVIVTLGANGCQWVSAKGSSHCPTAHVTPVDTTAAGDVFNGALVTFLAEGREMGNAIDLANHAAALSTTRPGAQESAPTLAELTAFAPGLI